MKKATSKRVRAILVDDGKLLTIKRNKTSQEYWVLPGGGIEKGETPEQALVREVKEETGIDCVVNEFVMSQPYKTAAVDHDVAYYRATRTGGTIGTGTGPEFTQPHTYEGTHTAEWAPLSDVPRLELLPPEVKERVVSMF
jgi:8-oxo-dGTP diphosphatase